MGIWQTIEKVLTGATAEEKVAMQIELIKRVAKKHAAQALEEMITSLLSEDESEQSERD